MSPKEAFGMLYETICGHNGLRLTLPEHQKIQTAFQAVQSDMKCFEKPQEQDKKK